VQGGFLGYPVEESPFAEAVRKELQKSRGEEWVCEEGKPETMRLGKLPLFSSSPNSVWESSSPKLRFGHRRDGKRRFQV
jgi:hypothetical protein